MERRTYRSLTGELAHLERGPGQRSERKPLICCLYVRRLYDIASATGPARLLTVFVVDTNEKKLCHLIPRRRANTRLVVQIAFFVVMTAILVGNDIAPHRFEGDAAEDAS
jgi:hypothetical protein